MDVGRMLRDWRVNAGLTQGELAERCGWSQARVSDFERGAVRLRADQLVQAARVCGVDGQAFAELLEEPPAAVKVSA